MDITVYGVGTVDFSRNQLRWGPGCLMRHARGALVALLSWKGSYSGAVGTLEILQEEATGIDSMSNTPSTRSAFCNAGCTKA